MATSKKTAQKAPKSSGWKASAPESSAVTDYPALLAEVKERIQSAQYAALRAVNQELVALYWDIGKLIVERQRDEGWGKAVVAQLASDLQSEFPGTTGFSASNLWRMKGFFEAYRDAVKLAPLVREVAWTHNLLILERCKDPLEREFYLRMTRKFGWSKSVLSHQIDIQSYEKSLLGQTNFDQVLTPELRAQAKLAVKDEYAFDFLELGGQHGERELEGALIARIEDFLRAMGGMFAFMGSQYRLEIEGKEYFIDLLLFHRRLRALVAVELKIGEGAAQVECQMLGGPCLVHRTRPHLDCLEPACHQRPSPRRPEHNRSDRAVRCYSAGEHAPRRQSVRGCLRERRPRPGRFTRGHGVHR